MSSILKALKKLEQEKTMRREGEIDLSREILHDAWRRKSRFPWPWAGAITTIVLLLALVAFLLSRETPTVRTTPSQVQTQAPPPVTPPIDANRGQTTPPPMLSPAKPLPAQTAPRKPAAAAPVQTNATIPVPLPTAQPQAVQAESPHLPPTAAPPATPLPAARKPAPPAETGEPAFAVSGIAWNKDSADRLAIVNGMPLTTGSAIGGAVIEEILPDRVRFSRGGGSFEVHLGKGAKNN